MKRSEINQYIRESLAFFNEMKFSLPKWAYWSPQEWKGKRELVSEIIDCGLGWDITDFGSGDFTNIGLINVTLRNGIPNKTQKTYCEKIIIVEENQVTPYHFHWQKMEDIINRGGGNLVFDIYGSTEDGKFSDEAVIVKVDGIPYTLPPGGKLTLSPGESIVLEQGVYHKFYGEAGHGKVLVGEVSSVNDDKADNRFYDERPRYPEIIEDEAPLHLLVNDYLKYV